MKPLSHVLPVIFIAVVLSLVTACAANGTHRATGEFIDDTVITTKVQAAILNDPQTKDLEIQVETYMGEVQLSGLVSSQEEADRAVELTRNIKGVTSVKNDMLIRQP